MEAICSDFYRNSLHYHSYMQMHNPKRIQRQQPIGQQCFGSHIDRTLHSH